MKKEVRLTPTERVAFLQKENAALQDDIEKLEHLLNSAQENFRSARDALHREQDAHRQSIAQADLRLRASKEASMQTAIATAQLFQRMGIEMERISITALSGMAMPANNENLASAAVLSQDTANLEHRARMPIAEHLAHGKTHRSEWHLVAKDRASGKLS